MVGTSRHQSAVPAVARVMADAADLVALALHGHIKPILLLHRVVFALVVTGNVG